MVDTPKTEKDFAEMSDEDFLKLDAENFAGDMEEGETDFTEHKAKQEIENAQESNDESESDERDQSNTDDDQSDESDDNTIPDTSQSTEEKEVSSEAETDPHAEDASTTTEKDVSINQQPGSDTQEKGKDSDKTASESGSNAVKKTGDDTPAKAGFYKMPEGLTSDQMDQAVSFYGQISKPFKADGKEIQIRTPDEAIRLMQMGMNYNRRMQELKPIKAMNRMLEDQNLSQNDLNYMIDLMKGNKTAIQKLIKDHNIDVMDLDENNENGYQATNYAGDAQTNAFRDAIDGVMDTPSGPDLITHIYEDWDMDSKQRLRENPSILGNLNAMKSSGVYDRVKAELDHQRTMGYLTDVPYLQAFDQVGEVMKNMGLFDSITQSNGPSMGQITPQTQKTPVAEGARKDSAPKKADPNPHLSSTPPSRQKTQSEKIPDYGTMSDEDFKKLAPPS